MAGFGLNVELMDGCQHGLVWTDALRQRITDYSSNLLERCSLVWLLWSTSKEPLSSLFIQPDKKGWLWLSLILCFSAVSLSTHARREKDIPLLRMHRSQDILTAGNTSRFSSAPSRLVVSIFKEHRAKCFKGNRGLCCSHLPRSFTDTWLMSVVGDGSFSSEQNNYRVEAALLRVSNKLLCSTCDACVISDCESHSFPACSCSSCYLVLSVCDTGTFVLNTFMALIHVLYERILV